MSSSPMSELEYGQQRQMEDPSMIGTLRTQAAMIWPLELPILGRLGFANFEQMADLGCGTGEFAGRLVAQWPSLRVRALDMYEGHLALAREAHPQADYPSLDFVQGDARDTGWNSNGLDAVTIRHVLHALPDVDVVLAESKRILKPGGLLYVLAEDYAGLIFDTPGEKAEHLFFDAMPALMQHGTNLFHGRAAHRELRAAGFEDVHVEPLVIDTSNTPRETFAEMLGFWRDGYANFIANALGVPAEQISKRFESLRYTVLDEDRYACWLSFVVSGRKPS